MSPRTRDLDGRKDNGALVGEIESLDGGVFNCFGDLRLYGIACVKQRTWHLPTLHNDCIMPSCKHGRGSCVLCLFFFLARKCAYKLPR